MYLQNGCWKDYVYDDSSSESTFVLSVHSSNYRGSSEKVILHGSTTKPEVALVSVETNMNQVKEGSNSDL